jgi:dihydrofolate synthase/folylpolyglutamate synthase
MTYAEAIRFLYDLRWHGAKLGLEHTFKLAQLAGNPHHRLRFIHVAGTNGKGSTCAMIESVYRASGLRVGLFTSPHLVSFSERIQVNRQPISEAAVAALVDEVRPMLAHFPQDSHPTFFEVVTVLALLYFERQRCDVVVWETGLGGRLDSTNIVTPVVSVITNVQYDHQKWLGETLVNIACEKAGIIKPGVPLVTGTTTPEALEVIRSKAVESNSPLTTVDSSDTRQPPLDKVRLPLLGEHQRLNAAVAVAAIRAGHGTFPINESAVVAGLTAVNWPGRLQLIRRPSSQRVLLDGAHNVGGAEMLAQALKESFGTERPTMMLGILADKDWAAMCRILAPLAQRILLVPVHSERTADPHALAEVCRQARLGTSVEECPDLTAAFAAAEHDSFVTVAGSLYLIGEAMELLNLYPGVSSVERELNEWGLGKPSLK